MFPLMGQTLLDKKLLQKLFYILTNYAKILQRERLMSENLLKVLSIYCNNEIENLKLANCILSYKT